MNHDITFCPNKKCERFDCFRHDKYIPFNIPVSRFREVPKIDKNGNCSEYLGEGANKK